MNLPVINFEPDYQKRVLVMTFSGDCTIDSAEAVQAWRQQWMQNLSSWHSPYKVYLDTSALKSVADGQEVQKELEKLLRFFKGFFMQKIVAFRPQDMDQLNWPIETHPDETEARKAVGLEKARRNAKAADFRSTIQLKNDFQRHVIELSFSENVCINSHEHWQLLKSKLMNNLMQWHSKWSLLIDCQNLGIESEFAEDWRPIERYFKGFFLKSVVGYQPQKESTYPFQVFRSRHKAVAQLESEGNYSGDKAHCRSGA